MTGLAVMSLISKLESIEILAVFSDHRGVPSSYLKAIISPLLNGAMIIFSIATGDDENILLLDSIIVWNDHSASPVLRDIEKMRLSAEQEKTRLSEYHQYEDGGIDQPFLTPETAKNDD